MEHAFTFVVCNVIHISVFYSHILYTLVKQSRTLRAFKLARHVLEKLCQVKVPPALEASVDLLIIQAKADPFEDNHELQPHCYRCSTTNPLVNPRGNTCINCFHPFIYSFPSFGE
jgi:intraflagellar transport protein 122